MAASKTTKKRKRKPAAKQQPVGNRFQTEILILVMFAACLILMISAFGMGGIVGNAISAVCFGIMGLCAYIFPILLFAGVTFLIVNNTNRLAYKKVLAGVVFFVFLCGFLQLITEGYTPSTTFSDYYSLSSEYRTGGGVFGGAVCISTASAFGVVGGTVIIVLVLLVSLIIITQRSFFGFMNKILDFFTDAAREGREAYLEGQPDREKQKELRRKIRAEKRAEKIRRLEEGKVKMYVCGPTVYNLIHIGNARPMIIFDTVRRYMEYKGYEVNYVSNFTDVDDKIIKKAIEEGVSAEEISTRYIKECKKDMADMNVKPATTAPQATQEIQGMIDMIQTLIDKGYAYPAADGTVYFRVKKFKEYGKLSHKNLDDLQSGFRSLKVSGEDQKEDPLDFVLWKPKKEGEPSWPSPWCDGRPGWHIECSVMSKKYLGEEIDIHAGGEDLIFPHHENEIAQSECCNGKIFARYWMHNGFLNIDNRKMSKSLGNFRTVRQIGEQYDLQVLRFFMLNAHYRSPLNFSADLMEAAKNSLERILEAAGKLSDRKDNGAAENITEEELALLKEAEGFVTKFEAAMDDDFNTADALAAIFELVKFANTNVDENSSREFAGGLYEELFKLSDVLGLKIEKKEEILDKEIEDLIQERQAARKAKDFQRADEIRDELLKKGIILKDTREGVKWQRA